MSKVVNILNIIAVALFLCFVSTGCSSNKPTYYSDDEEEDSDSPLTFHGYTCTDDCSGHQAGYDWAEENSITDPDDCSGNSQSFIEGCQAYTDEN